MINQLKKKKEKISVIGMGYVGLPLAVAFAEKGINVVGFDINQSKIDEYIAGHDSTEEVGDERLQKVKNILFTSNPEDLKQAKFHIVAVPTPVLKNKMPDLRPVEGASRIVGQNLTKGAIVVYESTVYPGVTEEICIPILERESGMKCGVDFKIGYSPERINPGDKLHRVETIVKVTSGMDEESAEIIAQVYEQVIQAGVHRATSIKVAEAAKVIENSQRDINIAFVNELAIIFNKLGINTNDVLVAAGTKWNFLPFKPGLVGGHCIGVDPYYLTHKAQSIGYNPEIILAGRRLNDNMGIYVANQVIKLMIKKGHKIEGSKVLVLGITFKENCPDIRNSRVIDVIEELQEFGCNIDIYDPWADTKEVEHEYNLKLIKELNIAKYEAIVLAVAHNEFKQLKLKTKDNVVFDIKSILDETDGRL